MDTDAMTEAGELDGCYVLKTDLPAKRISKEMVNARYKDLAQVEWAFRTSKTGAPLLSITASSGGGRAKPEGRLPCVPGRDPARPPTKTARADFEFDGKKFNEVPQARAR